MLFSRFLDVSIILVTNNDHILQIIPKRKIL